MHKTEKIIKQFKAMDEKDALLIREGNGDIYRFTHQIDDGALFIDFSKRDALSAQLMQIRLTHNRIRTIGGDSESRQQLGDRLCEEVSYLSENLKIIEIDRTHRQMQIRSYPPYVKGHYRMYFEILVDYGKSSVYLVRNQSDTDAGSTKQASFVLSDEVLTRLLKTIFERFINQAVRK